MMLRKKATTPPKKENPLKQFNQNCPNCKHEHSVTVLRCKYCGLWFDREVFSKLSKPEIELIQKNDLVVVTPSIIYFMIGVLLSQKPENILANNALPHSKSLSTVEQFRILLYFYWCAFRAVRTSAYVKTGYDQSDLSFPFLKSILLLAASTKNSTKNQLMKRIQIL